MPSRDPHDAPGRLGAFTLLGAAAGGVPLPWVPRALLRRVRGALVQDVAARHGLALSLEARGRARGAVSSRRSRPARPARPCASSRSARSAGSGPSVSSLPVRTALDTFVLGRLFTRYLSSRSEAASRIEEGARRSMSRNLDRRARSFRRSRREVPAEAALPPPPGEDPRDEITQAVDGALIATAGVPSWLVRHLDAAFDEVLAGDQACSIARGSRGQGASSSRSGRAPSRMIRAPTRTSLAASPRRSSRTAPSSSSRAAPSRSGRRGSACGRAPGRWRSSRPRRPLDRPR